MIKDDIVNSEDFQKILADELKLLELCTIKSSDIVNQRIYLGVFMSTIGLIQSALYTETNFKYNSFPPEL